MSSAKIALRVGNTVIYTDNQYGDSKVNPLWGGKHGYIYGDITGFGPGYVRVKWRTGRQNTYSARALTLVVFNNLGAVYTMIPLVDIPIIEFDGYNIEGQASETQTLELPKDRKKGLFNL